MSDLRVKLAQVAEAYPPGSPQRAKLVKVLAASMEEYETEMGKPFRMKTTDFARFLRDFMRVRPGPDMGQYLRGEKKVPGSYAGSLQDYGAKIRLAPPRRERTFEERLEAEPGPDINRLYENLQKAIWAEFRRPGDAGDYFVNMPKRYDDDQFLQYLDGISGDLALNWRYDLSDRAEKWLDKLELALQTGVYKGYLPDFLRTKRQREEALGDLYSTAWHDSMVRGWEQAKKNPRELARLKALRA